MPGTEPYTTTCKFCGKPIIMGLNQQSKWQPWDNYANKEGHNCAARPKEKQNTITANEDTEILSRLNRIEQKLDNVGDAVSMANWMHEKVAKKLGVDDLIETNE